MKSEKQDARFCLDVDREENARDCVFEVGNRGIGKSPSGYPESIPFVSPMVFVVLIVLVSY